MADRYISREWLLKTINAYKNIKTWNTKVCDPDTVLRVLQVNENYIMAESVNNIMPMGFYKGRVQVDEQVIDWLERMVRDG